MAKRTGSIVTYVHHYKPPRKKAKAGLAVPAIVTATKPGPRHRPVNEDPEAQAQARAFVEQMLEDGRRAYLTSHPAKDQSSGVRRRKR